MRIVSARRAGTQPSAHAGSEDRTARPARGSQNIIKTLTAHKQFKNKNWIAKIVARVRLYEFCLSSGIFKLNFKVRIGIFPKCNKTGLRMHNI